VPYSSMLLQDAVVSPAISFQHLACSTRTCSVRVCVAICCSTYESGLAGDDLVDG